MSRRENILLRKHKLKKLKFISKLLFIFVMIVNLVFCIYIIDRSAKAMLGESNKYTSISLINIQAILDKKINEINEIGTNIIKEFNE